MISNEPLYRAAFSHYLRTGASPRFFVKQAQLGTHYIWRTQRDGKVRPTHAANDGKVFAWNDPPPTGHPGQEFGCRCYFEPYEPPVHHRVEEALDIENGPTGESSVWSLASLTYHYLFGEGAPTTLRELGLLTPVVNEYMRQAKRRLLNQIATAARETAPGEFTYTFGRGYPFKLVSWAIGGADVSGTATGSTRLNGDMLTFANGSIEFMFRDHFRDAADLTNASPDEDQEIFGTAFVITDEWNATIHGQIYRNPKHSIYK